MSDSLDPRDDLTERLAALGRQPVAPALQSQHLTAMASVPATRSFRASLAGRLKVAAGVFAGFLLGASGLTAVGAMGPMQPAAAKIASEVAGLEVPKGPKAQKEAKAKKDVDGKGSIGTARDWTNGDGPDCAPVAGTDPAKFAGNRGQYLKQERAKGADALAAAKASTCGKPIGGDDEADEPKDPKEPKNEDAGKSDEDHGKKDAAPGQEDKGEPGSKAQGPKDGEGADNKPADAGPPAEDDTAGTSGITPADPQTPAEPEKPAEPETAPQSGGEV